MRIVVRHYLVEKLDELPDRKVTVEVVIPEEAGGEDVQGPIDLTLGQQLTLEVAASEFEYPGGGIEGCFPAISDTQIQAVIDEPGASGLAVNPTYAKALGTDEERQERRRVEERRGRGEGPPTDAELLDRAARQARRELEAQHGQIRAAIELAVRELRHQQTNLARARLRDGLQELLDGNAALAKPEES